MRKWEASAARSLTVCPTAIIRRLQRIGSLRALMEIDVLKERYRQAVEYMAWFVPAWEELTEDERYVLEAFYGEDNQYGSNAADDVADYFQIERASAYRRRTGRWSA